MDNLKVWTFHPTSRNALGFIFLSVLFLVLQQSLQSGLPFLNVAFLKKVLTDQWLLIMISLPAVYTTLRQRKTAPRWFAIFTAFVAYRSLEGLFLDFNKLVLVVLFFHVVISYAFYQLMQLTYTRAAFSPNYAVDTLHTPMGMPIPVSLAHGNLTLTGRLTNWDDDGAFVWLESELDSTVKVVSIQVLWEGHVFQEKGAVVSGTWDGKGIGIEWEKTLPTEEDGWCNLMALFEDYGYEPKLLR